MARLHLETLVWGIGASSAAADFPPAAKKHNSPAAANVPYHNKHGTSYQAVCPFMTSYFPKLFPPRAAISEFILVESGQYKICLTNCLNKRSKRDVNDELFVLFDSIDFKMILN
jgi:hypothetical protein